MGLFLATQEVSELFRHFDVNGDEQVDMQEFLATLQGEMSEKRLAAVKMAFRFLDTADRGMLSVSTLQQAYRSGQHPRVATREKTPALVAEEFKAAIESYADAAGNVSEDAFLAYYLSQGATVPVEQDDYFVSLIVQTWGIDPSEPQEKLTALKNIIFEKVRQRVHGNDDEGKVIIRHFRFYDLDSSGALNVSEFSKALSHLGCAFNPGEVHMLFNEYDTNKNGLIDYEEFAQFFSVKGAAGTHQFSTQREPPVAVMDKVRKELLRRGPHGMHGLSIVFRRLDTNHDGAVNKGEFEWVMRENGQVLSPMELDRIFRYFDASKDGKLSQQEFMLALRGDLNDTRKAITRSAFSSLDPNQTGKVTLTALIQAYDPSYHPQFRSGAKTSAQVVTDFRLQWDNVDKDGCISAQDFEEYYQDFSASVERDEDFLAAVRSAWRLP